MVKQYAHIILSFIAVILFGFGYWICIHCYPEASPDHPQHTSLSVNNFTDLRYNLYSVLFGICMFLCLKLSVNKWMKFAFSIGFGLSISDIVDRYVSGVTTFQYSDRIIIIFTVITAVYNLIPKRGN